MKNKKDIAKYLTYLSGEEIREEEISKDLIFSHELAKKIFGEDEEESFPKKLPTWKVCLKGLVLYTDDEIVKFFSNVYQYRQSIEYFKKYDLNFERNYETNANPGDDGEIDMFYNNVKYIKPLYDFLKEIGFNISRVSKGTIERNYKIFFKNDQFDIPIMIENNPFYDNFFNINCSKCYKYKCDSFETPEDLVNYMKIFINYIVGCEFENADSQLLRDYKSYMLLNELNEFDAVDYLKELKV